MNEVEIPLREWAQLKLHDDLYLSLLLLRTRYTQVRANQVVTEPCQMIDSSLKTKLTAMKIAMKEVG